MNDVTSILEGKVTILLPTQTHANLKYFKTPSFYPGTNY